MANSHSFYWKAVRDDEREEARSSGRRFEHVASAAEFVGRRVRRLDVEGDRFPDDTDEGVVVVAWKGVLDVEWRDQDGRWIYSCTVRLDAMGVDYELLPR